jgi:hypothetical protein
MKLLHALVGTAVVASFAYLPAQVSAGVILYNNDSPNGLIATATTPAGNGFIERETGDDFILQSQARLNSATFTGLVPAGATIQQVVVEIYRVFPLDSGPFDNRVPTRMNSPSDVEFADRNSAASSLTFTTNLLSSSFAASNSVINGINPSPNQTTGGEGARTGQEVQFVVTFNTPINLPADHYFFVPQVLLGNSTTPFLWLSAPRPPSVTPFTPDLQSWIRDANLDPDWLRVGMDIVGGVPAPTFNAAFSLSGDIVPEPSSLVIFFGLGSLAGLVFRIRK